jgi:hypothetical protein
MVYKIYFKKYKIFSFHLESIAEEVLNNTLPLTAKQKAKVRIYLLKKINLNSLIIQANREIQVDETTGTRTFRDESGRLRYLCLKPSCTNMLKRQGDLYCQR